MKGRNSHVHREFPGSVESSNLIRDNVSREIGCIIISSGSRSSSIVISMINTSIVIIV